MTLPTKTSEPPSITLILSVGGGGDFGPFFAAVTLDRAAIELLLRRAEVFRAARALSEDLYQTTYFDYMPEYFESIGGLAEDTTPEDAAKIDAIFDEDAEDEERRFPMDGYREADPGELPEEGNVRLDYSKLIVCGSMSERRPGMVDFYWKACVKHTEVELETCELQEEDVRALLGRLPPG